MIISDNNLDGSTWTRPLLIFNLIVYVILKFIFNILSLSCPIPGGAFAPVFVLGAGIGRLFGAILSHIGYKFGIHLINCTLSILLSLIYIIEEGLYSLIGAAALGGAATNTLAPAIMVLEMTG